MLLERLARREGVEADEDVAHKSASNRRLPTLREALMADLVSWFYVEVADRPSEAGTSIMTLWRLVRSSNDLWTWNRFQTALDDALQARRLLLLGLRLHRPDLWERLAASGRDKGEGERSESICTPDPLR